MEKSQTKLFFYVVPSSSVSFYDTICVLVNKLYILLPPVQCIYPTFL